MCGPAQRRRSHAQFAFATTSQLRVSASRRVGTISASTAWRRLSGAKCRLAKSFQSRLCVRAYIRSSAASPWPWAISSCASRSPARESGTAGLLSSVASRTGKILQTAPLRVVHMRLLMTKTIASSTAPCARSPSASSAVVSHGTPVSGVNSTKPSTATWTLPISSLRRLPRTRSCASARGAPFGWTRRTVATRCTAGATSCFVFYAEACSRRAMGWCNAGAEVSLRCYASTRLRARSTITWCGTGVAEMS
mmetsp:Transcript_8256/g.27233  ORF Transcript_8256/g.27233 Transcript_8256/m.27233 type:complete len:251 (+) Transcript_8256:223-975(+)